MLARFKSHSHFSVTNISDIAGVRPSQQAITYIKYNAHDHGIAQWLLFCIYIRNLFHQGRYLNLWYPQTTAPNFVSFVTIASNIW